MSVKDTEGTSKQPRSSGTNDSPGSGAWRCFRALQNVSLLYFLMRKDTQKCPKAMLRSGVQHCHQRHGDGGGAFTQKKQLFERRGKV